MSAQSSSWNTSSTSILKYFDIRSINSADGVYCVDISGIMAYGLNKNYVGKVTGKDNACITELNYGPFSYAEKVVDSGNSSSELKNLMNALYWYWNMGESLKKVS